MKETNSNYVRKTIDKNVVRKAFIKSMPIMFSYFFVSVAYGMMMENAGFHWYYSLLASATVYTGAFQFVLITFLSSGASILTVAVTYKMKHSTLISILCGTICYMCLIRL
ncbi:MAG: AzlC family ABC transporter permease [Lachnospiraceae bacterium]|nr:AzlC family ABC transporter permease [Lachnospiraceae bacterium]